MYGITDLTKGTLIEYSGEPFQVISSVHSKIGRGGGMQRVKMRSLLSGTVLDVTFKGADKISPAKVEANEAQFLYREGTNFYFMDTKNYEQFSLSTSDIDEAANYLKEGENYVINSFKGKPIKVELPIKIKLKVTQAEAGLRGDTANSPTKVVTLETGMKLSVPLFVKEGDFVLVDTRDGSYAGRVS